MLTGFFSDWRAYTNVVGKAAGRFIESCQMGVFRHALLLVIIITFLVDFLKIKIVKLLASGIVVAFYEI